MLTRIEVQRLNVELRAKGKKWCSGCQTAKGLAAFNQMGKLRLDARCKACRSRTRGPAYLRAKLYGLDEPTYNAMLAACGGICPICRKHMKRVAVDHCHATGRIRGLLCYMCNTYLGRIDDDPSALQRAIEYLAK